MPLLEKPFKAVLLGIFLFFWSFVSYSAPSIKEIKVEGLKRIEEAAVRTKIQHKVGGSLSSSQVEADIKAIHSLGLFDHIEVAQEDSGGGIRLIYTVTEKPIIRSLGYEGLEELGEDEAKEEVEVKIFEVLDNHKLNNSIKKLLAKYEEKGFYLADARYEIKIDANKNEADVVFKIEENDQIQVKRINIIGAKKIPSEELKSVMHTQEGGPFSWLSGSGTYREAAFDRDIAGLQYYYGTLGYVKARIGKPVVSVSPDRRYIYITFNVEEGEQYFVGTVDFEGELLYTRDELFKDLKLIQGEVFNTDTLRRETLRYTDMYADLGYAFVNVVPQHVVHDDTRTVDIVFEVDKGQRVYIGRITITGNTRTKDKVIRRQLLIGEGELFSGTNKRESRENVVRLGFFENVEFHQTTSKTAADVVDIEIRVTERSTGQLVIGAGYATGNIGFTAHAQLSQNNFLGNGQVASLNAQLLTGQEYYQLRLSFFEPYLGYSNWSLGGDIFHERRVVFANSTVESFQENNSGFAIKTGHPIYRFTRLFLTYQFKSAYVPENTIIDRTLITKESVNGITSSTQLEIEHDKRDDRLDPRSGYFWSLAEEYAGLGGDRNYLKSTGNFKFFVPVVWDLIFRFNFRAGNLIQTSTTPIPINELYLQGGLFTLRGYRYLGIGPRAQLSSNPADLSQKAKDNNLAGTSIPIGGRNEVLVNAELEFPILKEARIRGVIFFDAGNAFNGFFDGVSPALMANAGWGIRWWTPIGPLRFEFGYPIVNPGVPQFHFTIGPPF